MIHKQQIIDAVEKIFMNVDLVESPDLCSADIVDCIAHMEIGDLIEIIRNSTFELPTISAANISQFSKFMDIDNVIRIVMDSGYENISFVDMGYFLIGKKSEGAKRKYGENHYKLCAQLGLVTVNEPHEVTWLGKAYREMTDENLKLAVCYKLSLRVPIIERIMLAASEGEVSASELMLEYLSDSTMRRRRSNIRKMIKQMEKYSSSETKQIFENVRW